MATANTLWEFYQQKGQSLPSLSERAKLYESLGLGSATAYAGTAPQNTALLQKLAGTDVKGTPLISPSGTPYPLTSTGEVPLMTSGKPVPVPTVAPGGTTPYSPPLAKTVNVQGFTIDTATGEPIDPKTGKPLTEVTRTGEPTSGPDYYYTQVLKNPTATPQAKAEAEAYFASKGKTREEVLAQVEKGVTAVGESIKTLQERIATEGITGLGGVVLQAPTKGVVTSEVPRTEEARTIAEQAAKQVAEETEIRTLQRQRTLAELKAELGIDTGIPVRPVFATDFEALRSEQGMTALESQINSLETQIRDSEASLRQGLYTEEGQLRPMELIGTRQRELTRQAQEQMDTLNRRKTTLVDEYNTKVDLVNTIMNLKMTDYSNAVNEYNTKFSQAIQMQTLLMNIDEKERAEETAFRDDARANLTLLLNTAKEAGKTYAQLDPMMQLTMKKLELQGELPSGVTEFFLSNKPDAEVLWSGTGVDAEGNDIVTFVYKDANGYPGTTQIAYTGGVSLPAGVSSATADDMNRVNKTNEYISARMGLDDLISAGTWLEARVSWVAMGGTPSQYDDLYNPALLMGDWEWSKLPLEMQPKGATKQFLTEEYFTSSFTETQLNKAAKAAGFKSWTGRVDADKREEYLAYLINNYIPQQRKREGVTDNDILDAIMKTM